MGGAGGGIFSIGKSKAQLFDKKNSIKITFKDVAGLEGAKEEVQEIVSFLKNPKKYTSSIEAAASTKALRKRTLGLVVTEGMQASPMTTTSKKMV